MRLRLVQSTLALTTLLLAGTASAHFNLKAPVPSSPADTSGGKGGRPCGPDTTPGTPTPVTGGTMIPLTVDEFVPHPGHYRIALVMNSRDELMALKDPDVMDADGKVITSGSSATAVIQAPPVFPVIADNVLPHTSGGGEQTAMIPIPNVNCDHCVLQVIEFMAKHGPDYFYRHCADLKITADPNKPIFDPSGMGGTGGAGGAGGAAGGQGGAASGAGGANPGGGGSGGTAASGSPGTAGTASGGTSGSGTSTAGTSSLGGSTPSNGGDAEDDGSCTVSAPGLARASSLGMAATLLLGLGLFRRRRNRAE